RARSCSVRSTTRDAARTRPESRRHAVRSDAQSDNKTRLFWSRGQDEACAIRRRWRRASALDSVAWAHVVSARWGPKFVRMPLAASSQEPLKLGKVLESSSIAHTKRRDARKVAKIIAWNQAAGL